MTAAVNHNIGIVGALVLGISGISPSGNTLLTRQIVYFTYSSDRLFMSKQACIALGIGEIFYDIHMHMQLTPCSTIITTHISFTIAIEENRDKLETWLLDYHMSSTFNTLEHQDEVKLSRKPRRTVDLQPLNLSEKLITQITGVHDWFGLINQVPNAFTSNA